MDGAMHRTNTIAIDADLDLIYRLGAEIERWPEILPHYRAVEVLQRSADGSTLEARMAARRGRIPVSWTCRQVRHPLEPRIAFSHIGGFTRGMEVAWTFERTAGRTVIVRIEHEFQKGWPVLDGFVSARVVGDFFVSSIAGQTLARIKELAERDSAMARRVPASEWASGR
jgi:ribosome-associated toxin RatA of RatAB toxin-antitoxin module